MIELITDAIFAGTSALKAGRKQIPALIDGQRACLYGLPDNESTPQVSDIEVI